MAWLEVAAAWIEEAAAVEGSDREEGERERERERERGERGAYGGETWDDLEPLDSMILDRRI
jgi:hypothetical protein